MSWRARWVYGQPSEKDSGWSFGLVNNATDLKTMKTRADAMAGILQDLLGAQTTIKFIRLSNVLKPRQAITYKWIGTGSGAPKGAVSLPSDVPQTALQLSLRTSDLTLHSTQTLRGIPDTWTTDGGLFTGGGNSGTVINALVSALKSGALGWVMRNLDPNRATQPITGITAAGVVTTAAPLAVPASPQNYVILNRVSGFPSTNRKFKAINAAGNTFQLFPWPPNYAVTPTVTAVSIAGAAVYVENVIGDVEADTGTTRAVGRPPKLATGRRKKRKT